MYKKKLGQTYYTNRHSCFLLQYHIHILFEADPFTAPGTLVNVIKTKTSRYARKQYGDTILKESCQDSLFWSNSYFTTIVNENSLQLVQEYIKNQ